MTNNVFWVDGAWMDAKAETDVDRAVWEALTNIEKSGDFTGYEMTKIEREMRRAIAATIRAREHRVAVRS